MTARRQQSWLGPLLCGALALACCACRLAGFLAAGLFDSLLDVPRAAFLFYLLVSLGLTLRAPRSRRLGPLAG